MKWGYYMAYLHEDANVFTAVITQAAQKPSIPEAIDEKGLCHRRSCWP